MFQLIEVLLGHVLSIDPFATYDENEVEGHIATLWLQSYKLGALSCTATVEEFKFHTADFILAQNKGEMEFVDSGIHKAMALLLGTNLNPYTACCKHYMGFSTPCSSNSRVFR